MTPVAFAVAIMIGTFQAPPEASEKAVYELRTYYAAPGKLDALHARFRDHTVQLFEKHGMTNIGYWVPIKNPDNMLIYLLRHSSPEAAKTSWAGFLADPAWKKAQAESEKEGKLVAKIERLYLIPTDYSPKIEPAAANPPRVFELRTYTASPGKLAALNIRFREHTLKLFEKHGMTNVGYWVPAPGQKGEADTLIYLLAHPSQERRDQAFDAFRNDPAWIAARKASEAKAGGSLTAPDGVKSLMLQATAYSPTK